MRIASSVKARPSGDAQRTLGLDTCWRMAAAPSAPGAFAGRRLRETGSTSGGSAEPGLPPDVVWAERLSAGPAGESANTPEVSTRVTRRALRIATSLET